MCQSVNDDLISREAGPGPGPARQARRQVEGGRSAHNDNQDKTRNNRRGAGDRVAGGAFGLVWGGGWIMLLFIGKIDMQGTLHRRRQCRID